MKKLLQFTLLLLITSPALAVTDTLSYYNSTDNQVAIWGSGYDLMARFDLPAPATVQHIGIWLEGNTGDQTTVNLYGHEGGTPRPSTDLYGEYFPQYLNPLMTPQTITKTQDGPEQLWIEVSEVIELRNNQFFVSCSGFTGDARLIMSSTQKTAKCESSTGGDLVWQFRAPDGGGSSASTGRNPFWVDVVLDFESTSSPLLFEEVTTALQIDNNLTNRNIAAADINGDHFTDLLIQGRLYINNNGSSFTEETAAYGLSGTPAANTMVDFDNDGDLDIVFIDVSDESFLYENTGAGAFTSHSLNIPVLKSVHSASFGDLNGDNLPDLFISQLWSTYPTGEPNFLLFNNGNQNFTDETTRLYPSHNGTHNYPNNPPQNGLDYRNRRSRGSIFTDFDNDGDLDLYVTNYFLEPDEFYRNNGVHSGNFSEISQTKGLDRNPGGGSNHGTGIDVADYNNDGNMDLLVPQFAHPAWTGLYGHRGTNIYTNTGAPNYNFTDEYGTMGIEFEETHAGGTWGDVNNDGLMDFFITTYYGCRYVDLYLQQPDHTFQLATWEYGIENIVTGNDALWLDYNNDGLLDLIGGENGRIRVYKNTGSYSSSALQINVTSAGTNSHSIGAQVRVYANGQIYTQEITAGRGQKMQKPYRLHFGLGFTTNIDSVTVSYPNGMTVKYDELEINKGYTLNDDGSYNEDYTLDGAGNGINSSPSTPELVWDVQTYPNPFTSQVELTINNQPSNELELELYDLKGQIFWRKVLYISSSSERVLLQDFDGLAAGQYLLKVKNGDNFKFKKLIKAE